MLNNSKIFKIYFSIMENPFYFKIVHYFSILEFFFKSHFYSNDTCEK